MSQQIPFFSLSRQWTTIEPKITEALKPIFSSQGFVGGKAVADFEETLKNFLNTKHVISCNSGTDALWLALKALELAPNQIVLTTPFSFIASSSEIVAHGAHPVFIDIDPQSYNLCPQTLEEWLVNNATMQEGKARHKETGFEIPGMIAVNIFGQCADYAALKRIAKEWGLWIVEDAAQSVGSKIDGKQASTFGDIGTFSFYPTKNLGACGDAGATVTDNDELARKLLLLRNHGRISRYEYEGHGINSRMDAIQAAILKEKLAFLPTWNERRQAIAATYRTKLGSLALLKLPTQTLGTHIYHQYCLRVRTQDGRSMRDEFIEALKSAGIGTNIFYPQSFQDIPFLNTHPMLKTECPTTRLFTKDIVALPVWPELTDDEVGYICDTVRALVSEWETSVASPKQTTETQMAS